MHERETSGSGTTLTAAQEVLRQLWEEHMRYEFATHNTEDTLATMVEDAYVNHIPVLTGGVGRDELREFYSKRFIPQMPPDTEIIPISRTIGHDQLVDEMVFTFTHTISVFLLGFITLFLSRFVLPEKIYPVLGAISGVSIVWIGAILLRQRLRAVPLRARRC